MAKDILKDNDGDILLIGGNLVWGDGEMQEVATLIGLNQGDLKYKPILGPNLIRFVKGKASQEDIDSVLGKHFKLDGKDYRKIKDAIQLKR